MQMFDLQRLTENVMGTVKVFKKDENNSFNFQKHVPGYPYICYEMELQASSTSN